MGDGLWRVTGGVRGRDVVSGSREMGGTLAVVCDERGLSCR